MASAPMMANQLSGPSCSCHQMSMDDESRLFRSWRKSGSCDRSGGGIRGMRDIVSFIDASYGDDPWFSFAGFSPRPVIA
jgi:hypothetical protein